MINGDWTRISFPGSVASYSRGSRVIYDRTFHVRIPSGIRVDYSAYRCVCERESVCVVKKVQGGMGEGEVTITTIAENGRADETEETGLAGNRTRESSLRNFQRRRSCKRNGLHGRMRY